MSQIEPPPNRITQFAHEWKNWLYNLWSNQSSLDTRITALEAGTGNGWVHLGHVDGTGVSEYIVTGLPSTAVAIKLVWWNARSDSGTGDVMFNIGDSSGWAASGRCGAESNGIRQVSTTGGSFIHSGTPQVTDRNLGSAVGMRSDPDEETVSPSNTWVFSGSNLEAGAEISTIAGHIENDSAAIDRVRLYVDAGNFDFATGSFDVYYQ